MDGEELTQATQGVLDPRRLGQQNSGFSDEDISDIICILYPASETSRREVLRLAQENSPHIIGRDDADGVETDLSLEDEASNFGHLAHAEGNYAIILRLSSEVKDASAGFCFGRNAVRGDIVFSGENYKRVSNVHFRIYVNNYGSVMIEDQSTNGTVVDNQHLTPHSKKPGHAPVVKWMLSSGSLIKIYLHQSVSDLLFRVRIPRRDAEYDAAYLTKVRDYFERHGLGADDEAQGGTADIASPVVPKHLRDGNASPQAQIRSPIKRRDTNQPARREWNGSGKYNVVRTIGKGAFAVVYQVTSKYDGAPYAAKELDKRRFIKNGVLDQKVENEMNIMQRIKHPNIVRYIENIEWEDRLLIIIMEYVSGGDLGKLIQEHERLPEDFVVSMAQQLLSALSYLHINKITHRDVKPDNILINSIDPLDVKLTDFGLSKIVDSEQTFLRTFCGTLLYCAPEVYTEYAEYDENGVRSRGKKARRTPGQRYDHAIDIWSLGGVLFYSLTGSPPYPVKTGISHNELLHMIMTTELNTNPLRQAGVSDHGIHFLSRMLDRRPERRSTIPELINHPWMGGEEASVQLSQQSFDELTDEEELGVDFDTFRQPTADIYGGLETERYDPMVGLSDEEDHVSDSVVGYESEKENNDGSQGKQQTRRLFGEVAASAIGSSGVMNSGLLNLAARDTSMGENEIEDSYADEAYASESDPTPRRNGLRLSHADSLSIAQNQSADQLNSLVLEVASQSLGGRDHSTEPDQNRFLSFNTSKRKPPSADSSGEFDENTAPSKPTMKRFKSETALENLPDSALEELRLIASLPPITRLGSGRQIDWPVDKGIWWGQDRRGWHLDYPEMTQLQYDAFKQACTARGEVFSPGQSPLWDLAMKYFTPSHASTGPSASVMGSSTIGVDNTAPSTIENGTEFPSTAAAAPDLGSLPDTQPHEHQIVVPLQTDPSQQRAIALIESHQDSVIQGISLPVSDSLITFGRGPENTQIFTPGAESRVPKYAFKILLWKDGYDPSKDPAKVTPPWSQDSGEDTEAYNFWISTKATLGIKVNGYHVASSDSRHPGGPSQCWVRLHDHDELLIWGTEAECTKMTFRCFWGGSSQAAADGTPPCEMASAEEVQKLNMACQRTEKRIKDAREKLHKINVLRAEHAMRRENVEKERQRSREFERKRQDAVELLQARSVAHRRGSPGSLSSADNVSRVHHGQLSRVGSDPFVARSVR